MMSSTMSDRSSPNDAHDLTAVHEDILSTLKLTELPTWAKGFSDNPHVLKGLWEMMKGFLEHSDIPPLLQELIIFSISRFNHSPYCTDYHAGRALRLNTALAPQDLLDISNGDSHGQIPESYQVAVNTATAYANGICKLNEAHLSALHAQGFSEPQIVDIMGLIALSNTFNSYSINLNFQQTSSDCIPEEWASQSTKNGCRKHD
jgi:alkylhydroperoxidase family enzyme